jgi:MFS-type transporter involved in bile tolerance (Atg22 family)
MLTTRLPRTVVVLGWVSLCNDAASEMLTPLLPVFLTAALGAGPAVVGLVEGVAAATASLLQLASGRLADRGVSPKGLVLGGYGLSNASRPLMGLALSWPWVLALRFADRVGKGVRTAPRDALLSDAVAPAERGRAFGFQRAMDHAGSVVGPLAAFALLRAGVELRDVFLVSVLPGAAVLALVVAGVPGRPRASALPADMGIAVDPTSGALRWGRLDGRLRALVLASGALALATAPEAFLVLWATARGLDVAAVPLVWAAAHALKAAVAAPAGRLSDRVGRLPVVAAGWAARVVVLLALARATDGTLVVWVGFLAYAAALAATEGAERALVGDLAPPDQRATAFGLYYLVSGILALPGALAFGTLWQSFGSGVAFATSAALTAAAAATLIWIARRRPRS